MTGRVRGGVFRAVCRTEARMQDDSAVLVLQTCPGPAIGARARSVDLAEADAIAQAARAKAPREAETAADAGAAVT